MGCTNPECQTKHFPRTDPATIMLVHSGDRCLLGRQASWPEGMYSTLAGFVEPGEKLEEAVFREVKEESGILVKNIRYFGAQPWPFPQSLMLGFFAEAETQEITRGIELEDVRWFDLTETQELLGRLESRFPHLGHHRPPLNPALVGRTNLASLPVRHLNRGSQTPGHTSSTNGPRKRARSGLLTPLHFPSIPICHHPALPAAPLTNLNALNYLPSNPSHSPTEN